MILEPSEEEWDAWIEKAKNTNKELSPEQVEKIVKLMREFINSTKDYTCLP